MRTDDLHQVPIDVRYDGDITDKFMEAAIAHRVVAWDVETTGLSWEHDSIEVCQLHVPGVAIEVVVHPDAKPGRMSSLLNESGIVKQFHHAMFDLRFMRHVWGCVGENIVCTKIMSKLLRPESTSHRLNELLLDELGIAISKELATSEWASERLTAEQVEYAANDVRYLPDLVRALEHKLERAGLLGLASRCFEHIGTRVELEVRHYGDVYTYSN